MSHKDKKPSLKWTKSDWVTITVNCNEGKNKPLGPKNGTKHLDTTQTGLKMVFDISTILRCIVPCKTEHINLLCIN